MRLLDMTHSFSNIFKTFQNKLNSLLLKRKLAQQKTDNEIFNKKIHIKDSSIPYLNFFRNLI